MNPIGVSWDIIYYNMTIFYVTGQDFGGVNGMEIPGYNDGGWTQQVNMRSDLKFQYS